MGGTMRPIKPELTSNLKKTLNPEKPGYGNAVRVKTFDALVKIIAELSYINKDYVLFFRGQHNDFLNKNQASTFYPAIYRKEILSRNELKNKFRSLEDACSLLCNELEKNDIKERSDVFRRKYIQWSILQHYEVCDTPLIDLTQSIRVACSFAFSKQNDIGYFFTFGLPFPTNRISINSEHDIINIRLLSICPPQALRPHFQEGYLVGTFDTTDNYENKNELDLNNRLIAKFEIANTSTFWTGNTIINENILYPEHDRFRSMCMNIKQPMLEAIYSKKYLNLISNWEEIESKIYKKMKPSSLSNDRKVIEYILNSKIDSETSKNLIEFRKYVNRIKANPNIEIENIDQLIDGINEVKKYI
jgi:hypothetical protein